MYYVYCFLFFCCSFYDKLIVAVIENTFSYRSVTGGNLGLGCNIVHVFYAVLAKDLAPVRLVVVGVCGNYIFVHTFCKVESARHTKVVCLYKKLELFGIVGFGNRLLHTAKIADRNFLSAVNLNFTSAIFTIKIHFPIPFKTCFVLL